MSRETTDLYMQTLARLVDSAMCKMQSATGPKLGFALLVFELDKPQGSRTNYVGSCRREDILVALKEVVARWEGQPHQAGRA